MIKVNTTIAYDYGMSSIALGSRLSNANTT